MKNSDNKISMFIDIRKLRFYAFALLGTMVWEICFPTLSMAIGRSTQPETASFAPAGMDNMVDLFTGNFSYNIDLLTVPGPNGGYPINLHYNSGVSMEQEASWCGLGWNLNVGSISRQLQGVPDDWNGENITNIQNSRVERTLSLTRSKQALMEELVSTEVDNGELLGYEDVLTQASDESVLDLQINTYRGLRFDVYRHQQEVITRNLGSTSIRNSTNSSWGFGSLSGAIPIKNKKNTESLHAVLGSFEISNENSEVKTLGAVNSMYAKLSGTYGKISHHMAGRSGILNPSLPIHTTIKGFEISNWDVEDDGTTSTWSATNIGYKGISTKTYIDEFQPPTASFGFMHSENADENSIMDFRHDGGHSPAKHIPFVSAPVQLHDNFSISGQGIGGTFRAFREDIGIYHPSSAHGKIQGGELGLEAGADLGVQNATKIGGDGALHQGGTYVGEWRSHNGLNSMDFSGDEWDQNSDGVYFAMYGEQIASELDVLDNIRGQDPVAFQLMAGNSDRLGDPGAPSIVDKELLSSQKARVINYSPGHGPINPINDNHNKRVNSIRYVTQREILQNAEYNNPNLSSPYERTYYDVPSDQNPEVASNFTLDNGSQIAQFEVTDAKGLTYVYGLPKYQSNKTSTVFRTEPEQIADFDINSQNYLEADVYPPVVPYELGPDGNNQFDHGLGQDHFYSSRTFDEEYASEFLLTELFSPDYVDLTDNGPTDDDLGYWVKFSYDKYEDHNWRSPYHGGYYDKGDMSDYGDDMISFEYGTQDLYYLSSVETKTHIAKFITSPRTDNVSALNVDNADENDNPYDPTTAVISETEKVRRLDKIDLFSKSDLGVPLKSVHFTYSYELCPGVPNSTQEVYQPYVAWEANGELAASQEDPIENENGRLTLKSVYFTFQDNMKGKMSPYKFDYGERINDQLVELDNPPYETMSTDRWGTYRPQYANGQEISTAVNPYTQQTDYPDRERYAAAWALKKIELPTGGWIEVEYEQDTYQHVQNVPATQMMRIVATTNTDTDAALPEGESSLKNDMTRIWFKLLPNTTVYDYVDGLSNVYFKTYQDLKNNPLGVGDQVQDYVEGWAQLVNGGYGEDDDGTYGYIDVKPQPMGSDLNPINVHPFRRAGWQYIFSERADLISGNTINALEDGLISSIASALSAYAQHVQMLISNYGYANLMGWCDSMENTLDFPSYIRLNSPGTKYGGGHRVKRLVMKDHWAENNPIPNESEFNTLYGLEYNYSNPDGTSSGVATYEPLMGGEENCLRQPVDYSSAFLFMSFRSPDSFVEEPLLESYYPAPQVGYGNVVVTEIKDPQVTHAYSGTSTTEFYTAADFPVITRRTYLDDNTTMHYPQIQGIPTVGLQLFLTQGYSQGFAIELNDMHGKVKATESRSIHSGTESPPAQRTEYLYATDPANPTLLSSTFQGLTSEGERKDMHFGLQHDFFISMSENSIWNAKEGGNTGFQSVSPPMIGLPSAQVDVEYSTSNTRIVSTSKVIYKTGILKEVRSHLDGAYTTARNLVLDAETGSPVLTSVQNEWENLVYTYNYSAHRYYPDLAGEYQTYRNQLLTSTSSGVITPDDISLELQDFFVEGDEVQYLENDALYHEGWIQIDDITGDFLLLNEDGSLASDGSKHLIVSKPGFKNQQQVSCGHVITLNDPIISPLQTLIDQFNIELEAGQPVGGVFEFEQGCATAGRSWIRYQGMAPSDIMLFSIYESEFGPYCGSLKIEFDSPVDLTNGSSYFLQLVENTFILNIDGQEESTENWEFIDGGIDCLENHCFDVLHAQAVTLSDEWSYDFADVGDPLTEYGVLSSLTSPNTYRFGLSDQYRPRKSFLYQIDRLQDGIETNVRDDGIYQRFTEFDWIEAEEPGGNDEWTWVSEATKTSPYGQGLESKNALNVFSAQLSGHNNSANIATAQNSTYKELCFDGFEDYESGYSGHGHMNWVSSAGPIVFNTQAHTGKYSIEIPAAAELSFAVDVLDPNYQNFHPPGIYVEDCGACTEYHSKEYLLSAWVYVKNGADCSVTVKKIGVTVATQDMTNSPFSTIDGWQKLELTFPMSIGEAPIGPYNYTIEIDNEGAGLALIDDLRIHPSEAIMTSSVIDPSTYRLTATLDNNNYATFYIYDEQGSLVQTRVETEDGIRTISSARSNVNRLNQ